MNINSNEIAKNFSNMRMQKKKLKKTIKNEEGKDRLKESINKNIDNKYLKFYELIELEDADTSLYFNIVPTELSLGSS